MPAAPGTASVAEGSAPDEPHARYLAGMQSRSLSRAIVVGAATLALAAALWFAFRGPAAPGSDATSPVRSSEVQPADGSRAATVVLPTPPAVPADPEAAAARAPTSEPATPGSTVGLDAGPIDDPVLADELVAEEAPAGAPSAASATLDFSLDERDLTGTDAGADPPNVVVPTSYPVTDAERYFVPRDERGPGNLGGPPPLAFPGGPNGRAGDPASGVEAFPVPGG